MARARPVNGTSRVFQPISSSSSSSSSEDEVDDEQEEYDVEFIRTWRYNRETKTREYFIKWRNWPEDDNTWEPAEHLNCPEAMREFLAQLSKRERKLHGAEKPEDLTGLQRNADIKCILSAINKNESHEIPNSSSNSSKPKFVLMIVFEDDKENFEEETLNQLLRFRPEKAFEWIEQRLIQQDALEARGRIIVSEALRDMSQPLNDYLPGFASLLEQIDKKVLVLLRDGRSLFGILRSIDQFANLVLHFTVERIYIDNEYGEIDRGVFLIRGENVVLCGEVDEDADPTPPGFTKVPIEVILENQARTVEEKSNRDKLKLKALQERGMLMHADGLADDM